MNLVGYVRVSTDAQADNTSFEEQRKRIDGYCAAHGHQLIEIFEEVGSAKNAQDRPQFQKALQALDKGDGLIASKLDRIARNTRDVLTLVEDVLRPRQKALVLLDINVDTSTPMGEMFLTLCAAFATLERRVINERTQGGRKAKANAGGFAYGSPPFGFTSVNGVLLPHSDEQAVINLIKNHRRSGKSLYAISKWLNNQGYRTKQGNLWVSARIKEILTRENTSKPLSKTHFYGRIKENSL